MNETIVGLIIVLVLLLVLVAVCYIAYCKIKQKVRSFLGITLNKELVGKGLDMMQKEYAQTPKSVSAATGLCLPRIMRDFPEFHYEEMKERAENVLLSYLRSLDTRDSRMLSEGTQELRDKLSIQIDMLSAGSRRHYEDIKIHRTEIYKYNKTKGTCGIVFQSAVEYRYYAETDGKVTEGTKDYVTQTKYNVGLIYIQNRDAIESTFNQAMGVNCPNCGAPLSGLGAKVCAYCDSPIVEFNIRTWNFGDVEEIS